MSKDLHNKLLNKGWSIDEIKRLSEVSKKAHEMKSPFIKFLDNSVYWVFLAVVIIGNLVVSIISVPLLIFFSGTLLYSLIITLGLILGLFIDHIIHDMEHITTKHHVGALLVIIPLGLISASYMAVFSSRIDKVLGLENPHNPIVLAVSYTVALLLPYIFTKIVNFKPR